MSKLITQTLADINGGKFVEEITEDFAEMIGACQATGKAGELTIKLKLKPGRGNNGSMQVDHDFTVKSPKFDRPTDYMFVGKDNSLTRNDPRQPDLPHVTVVQKDAGEIRSAERIEAPIAGTRADQAPIAASTAH